MINPAPQPRLCRLFADYQSESLGFLGVNLSAIDNSVTAVNYYNIRVVFVVFMLHT